MNQPEGATARTMIDDFLADNPLPATSEHRCPYLPGRSARNQGFRIDDLPGEVYHAFMDRGFRRSGDVVYRPICEGCAECRQIRVPVATFAPSSSQRRVARRNADVVVTIESPPNPTPDKWEVFHRYTTDQHRDTPETGPATYEDFVAFLYTSPTDTSEIIYAIGDQPAAWSIVDRCPQALSSVYVYFDPAHRGRGLGTFAALWEIDYCRREGIPYYYLGYYIADCAKMNYKARFAPNQLLGQDHVWSSAE